MAEVAVTAALNFLTPLLVEQVKSLGVVQEEVEFLKDELELLIAFLQDADQKQQNDHAVQVWVKQLREVTYDIEDVVDEFLLRVGPPSRRTGLARAIYRGTACIFNLSTRCHISKRVEGIKHQLKNISERKERLSLELKSNDSIPMLSSSSSMDPRLTTPLLLDEYELVGIEKPKEDLITMLMEGGSKLTVIPVVGMGGLGKTTLARKVYENQIVRLHFQCYAWITVSQTYDINTILRNMIVEFYKSSNELAPEGILSMDDSAFLVQSVKSYIRGKRYALFIDDVWEVMDWENIAHILPENCFGSRVIVTTRNHDVANSCVGPNGKYYELQILSPQHTWTLFCKKVFRLNAEGTCPSFLEEIARNILKICGGLPLAIITIAGLLRSKSMSFTEWDRVYRSLNVELETNKAFDNMKKILLISYDDLPYHLKLCFIYLSLFPEDRYIFRSIITQMWLAEGFLKPTSGISLEEVSMSCIEELVKRCLIQVVPQFVDGTGKGRIFVLHDLMHEVITSRSMEQKFVNIFECHKGELPDKVRRLSIHETQSMTDAWDSSNVRTLTIFDVVQGLQLSRFKGLKVLSLVGLPIESFPSDIVNLLHLRYLSLRETKIKVIPNSIKKLKWLQTLDVKLTHVEMLPKGILNCHQLVHIIASTETSETTFKMVRVPIEIGKLRSLRKLRYVLLNDYRHFRELGMLIQLKKLFVEIERGEDAKLLCTSMNNMKKLEALGLSIKDGMYVLDANLVLASSPKLKHIALRATLQSLTLDMIWSFESTCKIRLARSHLNDDSFRVLQLLPNLLDLTLVSESYNGEELCFELGSFSKLKSLRLLNLSYLTLVKIVRGAIPQLQRLVIGWCSRLCHVPTGIESLNSLKVLRLRNMPKELTDKIRKDEGEDWDKVKHIPDIIVDILS